MGKREYMGGGARMGGVKTIVERKRVGIVGAQLEHACI